MGLSLNTITRLSLAVFTCIAYIGRSSAQTTPNQQLSPEELRLRHDWHVSMAQVPAPKRGCFQSDYPNKEWHEVACVTAPTLPMGPKLRPRPLVGGNGNEISAKAPTGLISTAIGSFDSVTGVKSVRSDCTPGDVMCMQAYGGTTVANAYTLQLNTNFLSGNICNITTDSKECAWEQFIYEKDGGISGGCGSCAYIQYWLFDIVTCPTGWKRFVNSCFRNSNMVVQVPNQAITNLGQLSLTGTVSATGESVQVLVGSTMYTAAGDNSRSGTGS